MKPSPLQLKNSLSEFIPPERILIRDIERIAFASDASFYRLIPAAVVFANGFEEIRNLFRFSRRSGVPITFRGAGTSLSGQAITDGILVEVARFWRNYTILDNGTRVRVQPGIIGARVNQALTKFQRKLGPDPASISTCTVGGILANNSSGMCCGVEHNSYQTLESMKFVLPSGTIIDTASVGADEQFRSAEPVLAAGIAELRRTILGNTTLCNRIRFKYRRKNTTGYSLNAFLDFERPVEIFEHLLIGSEGTLGFIGEAVLRTVCQLPLNYTGLLFFLNVYAASEAVRRSAESAPKQSRLWIDPHCGRLSGSLRVLL